MRDPIATYRVQLRPGFDFDAASGVVDYLARLGVSHFYASPYLQAAPGSTHGYDVVDPTRLNRELGGEEAHGRLIEALGTAGLGQLLDIVPNHMAISGPENRWWWDVLRNGPAGRYAPYFDVDWDPPEAKLRNQVLMPILGDHYARELEAGSIVLVHDDGEFTIRYHDQVLPVAPRALGPLVLEAARGMETEGREGDGDEGSGGWPARELAFLGRTLRDLPEPGPADEAQRDRRRKDLAVLDHRLAQVIRSDEAVKAAIDLAVESVNRDVTALDELLAGQNYRLAYWRAGEQELDYRRFFDIDSLAALRTEDEDVFQAVHGRVLEWLQTGALDGVRVDHPDGLRRPDEYFRRLRSVAPEAWIVAEKILMPDESMPDWPVDGTTGYDFLADVTGVLLDPRGETAMTELWVEVTGDRREFDEVVYEARREMVREVLGADLNRLANIFVNLCEAHRRYRDFTRQALRATLAEVAACLPVYRTYVSETGEASDRDRRVIDRAIAAARDRRPELDGELLDFLRAILVGRVEEPEARGLRMRFQQFTGPVAAKGEEDTAFYRYSRFIALNEVGGDPGRWGLAASGFHDRCRRRSETSPLTLNALSTHDTKRSEDVRARLLVLAEAPERWRSAVREWRGRTARHWPEGVDRDPGAEYLLYQTLVGAWPIGPDRVIPYMVKATREAKLRTSWTEPDEEYEAALETLVRALLTGPFREDLDRFVSPFVAPGRVVSLSQKLVQLTAPGVPDIYQGTELWDLSLVDPDNRRPVDFVERRRLLGELPGAISIPAPVPAATILEAMDSGLPKLWVVAQALRVRRSRPDAFGEGGGYGPLEVDGPAMEHVLAFRRGAGVAVVVPRFPARLIREGGWRGTTVTLPAGEWTDVLTGVPRPGGPASMEQVLQRFPVALFVRDRP